MCAARLERTREAFTTKGHLTKNANAEARRTTRSPASERRKVGNIFPTLTEEGRQHHVIRSATSRQKVGNRVAEQNLL